MATIKDVALDAGVAVGTVSKVINGQYVSEKNRKKVEESIERLGYQMNFYARGLKVRNTYTVAAIVPETINPFFAIWVYYLEQALYKNGYKMLLCNTQGTIEKEQSYFRMAAQNKVDGIICVTYRDVEEYVQEDIPVVSLDRHFGKKICCVSSDNYHGGELAAEKMISTGSTRLLYMRSGSILPGETMKRGPGFVDYCHAHGVSVETLDLGDDFEIFGDGNSSIDDVLQEFLIASRKSGKMRYDGIYTSTDSLAWLLLNQTRKLGIRVPEEVQIIGHDGLRMMNRGNYFVSTIVQPVKEMAEKSVEIVLKKIRGEETEMMTILPVKFADGGTTR